MARSRNRRLAYSPPRQERRALSPCRRNSARFWWERAPPLIPPVSGKCGSADELSAAAQPVSLPALSLGRQLLRSEKICSATDGTTSESVTAGFSKFCE
jgi:hypothetical protein